MVIGHRTGRGLRNCNRKPSIRARAGRNRIHETITVYLVLALLLAKPHPDTMENSTCSITSIGDLLDKSDRNLLNITTTIAACPNICSLAWGKGNPDLSGIGLNISYIMQAILAVLCGPILALIYSFHDGSIEERTLDRLSDIHKSFVDISAGFNIPVAIAAVIRICQYAPFFEQYFLLFLVGMQLCSFVNVACALLLFDKHHRRSVRTIPLYLGIQSVLLFVMFILMRNATKRVSIQELIEGCGGYHQALPANFLKQASLPDLSQPIKAENFSTRHRNRCCLKPSSGL